MIKASELRIGNRLRPRRVIDADSLPATGYAICAAHIAYTEEDLNSDWDPIPLTPEILEKSGFKKVESVHGGEAFTINEVRFLKEGLDYTLVSEDDDHYAIDRIGKPFHYVHQLQNLYFALTGEELNISQ